MIKKIKKMEQINKIDLSNKDEIDNKPNLCENKKKLIVLDINGVLCYKYFAEHLGKGIKKLLLDNINLDHVLLNKSIVFYRPGVKKFLEFCFNYFDVGFFSSTTEYNSNKIITTLL